MKRTVPLHADVSGVLVAAGVVPVVKIDDPASAVSSARTLADAGLPVVEVTVRTPAAACDAVAAIAAAAAAQGLPFVPGALTPSEVGACLEAGAPRVEFFPAGASGGAATVRALGGPFGRTGVRFPPTGGVRPETAAEYVALPNAFAVGGTWIAPGEDVADGRWDVIGDRARAAVALAPGLSA